MKENKGLLDERKDVAQIAKSTRETKSDKIIILLEGANDCSFFQKFIPKERTNLMILGIQDFRKGKYNNIRLKTFGYEELKKNGEDDTIFFQGYQKYLDEKSFVFGGYGDVSGKKALILTIKKQWAEKKLYPKRRRIDFYGIVDKDYDNEDNEIRDTGKIKNIGFSQTKDLRYLIHSVDIISEGRIISSDSNDVESMLFMYDLDTIKEICKEYFPEKTYLQDLYFSIDYACKIGFLRKEDKIKKLNLCFKKVFPEEQPYKYEQYIEDNNININAILSAVLEMNKFKVTLSQMPTSFINQEWQYCRGHDLMSILACCCVMKTAQETGNGVFRCKGKVAKRSELILYIEEALITDIINNTKIERYSNSKVVLFINEIMSNLI